MKLLFYVNFKSHLETFLIFTFIFIVFAGCKKKEKEEEEVLSFIEYKINGQFFHFESEKLPGILTSNSSSDYYLMGMANGDALVPKTTTEIELRLNQSSLSAIKYDQSNSFATLSFLHVNIIGNKKQEYYLVDLTHLPGNWQISFIKIGHQNEFSEGTFNIEGASRFNANDSIISTNTAITEGKFKVKMN